MGAASSSGKIGGEDIRWLLGTDSAAGFAEESGGGSSSAAPPSLARPPAPSGDSSWLLEMEEPTAPESGGKSDSAWVLGMGEDGSRPPATLGRVLESKRMRREAVTARDQAEAAIMEIEEMNDLDAKEKAVADLMRSLGQGETVDRMQRQGIKIDTGLIRQFLPKENRSKPLLYREFGEQANRLDGGPEPKQLPASERAAVGDAIERFNLTGGMTKKPTEATKAEARASDREVLKTLDDLARENAAREAERIVESSPIGDMAADISGKMGLKPQEKDEREVTPRERFDARRLLKTSVPYGLRNNSANPEWDMHPPRQPEPGGIELSASEAERIVAGEPDATFLGTAKESALNLKNQAVVGSVVRIRDAIAFHQAANRLQDMTNYRLREHDPRYIQDRQTVVSKQNEELLEAYRSKKGGIPYIAGNVAGQMPGFLAEMVMTGGAYVKAGNAVRRMVLGELAEQSFKQVAQRSVRRAVAAEGAKWAAGSLAQATAMPWRYAAGTAERMQPKATHFDETGQLVVDAEGDGFGEALIKAYADNAIEVASEHAGEAIEWVLRSPFRLARAAMPAARRGRLAAKVLEKTRWTRRELADLTNIAKGGGSSADMATFRAALRQMPDGTFAGPADLMPAKLKQVVATAAEKSAKGASGRNGGRAFMKAVSERAGFQTFGEYGEELAGGTARVAAGINDSEKSRWEQLKDVWGPGWEQFIGVNLGFATMGLLSLGGEIVAGMKSRHDSVRARAERLEAWKKANGESGSQTGRKWLDRYALADSPAELRQVEQDELAEARDSFAENSARAGASKEAVAAVRAAETWKELESAWEQARREGIGMLGQAMAADVREKGLGEDLAKRFENAKTEEDFNAAREERFAAIRNGHADDLDKAGRKDQAERVRQAKDEAAYNDALKQNFAEDVNAAADEMEAKGYLPEETAEIRKAESRLDFAERADSARFMRQRRELADTVAKAQDGAERAEAIRGIETGDTEALEQQRFEAFRDFAMPEIIATAGFSRELAEKAGRAKNHDELSMLLAEAIGKEIAAPASGLPSYIAEAVAAGDAQLAVYFGALRRMRLEQWKEAITGNVSKWAAAVPEGGALLARLAAAETEAEVADLAEQAEAMRQQARKMGLAGAAAAVATDATGAEDAAARIVEEMASGGLSAAEAVQRVAGPSSGIPGIPADPMPPIHENPVWKALSRPDSSAVARKIFDAEGDSGDKLAMIAAERARLGLPDLSLTASAAFHDAMEAGILTPRMVLDAIRLRETARKPVGEAKKKAETPPEDSPEAELRGEQAETTAARAARRAAEIVSSGAEAEATIAAIDRERERAGFEPLGASERGAAVRDIREGVFTAERAAGLILGRKPQAPAEPAKPKRRGLFGIPVSKRRTGGETTPATGQPQGDRIDMTTPQGGMKVKGRLVVVDLLKGMRSSYQDGYNQKWQNRLGTEGKTLEDKEERVDKIKREFDAREMMPEGKTMTDTGPMWIEPKSRDILSGNGRYKALWQLHREGRLQGYIERVRAEAAARGIDIPADVEVPAFAIEIDDGYDFDKFVDFSNRRRVSGYNAYETAIKDANVILRENLLDLFAPGDDGDVVNEQNRPFWTAFIRAVGAESDLYDTDGNPIVDQVDPRIRRAVLAALLKDKPNGQKLVQALVERANQMKAKAQVTAIMAAAGPVLQVENEKPGLSIANEFAAAVDMFLDFKPNEGAGLRKKFDLARAVEKYLATPQLFKQRPGAIEKALFRILVNSPGATAIRERFKAYVQLAAQVDTTSADLFGGGTAAANAASDRAEKIRMLEQALGVQVEAEDAAAKPKVRKRGAMRPVSERKKTISEPRRTVLPRRPTVTLATEAANRLGLPGGDGSTFHFVEDVADLPADVRAVLEKDANFGTSSKAFTMPDGSVYVLVNRHRDMADVLQSILHEDLESAMMPMMDAPEFLMRLDQAFEAAGLTAAYGEELRNIVLQYDYVQDKAVRNAVRHRKAGWEDALAAHLQKNTEARREVMRELLAHVRQRRAANVQDAQAKGMWEAIVEAIREFLSAAFGVNFTHADMQKNVPAIESLIDEITANRQTGEGGKTRMRNEESLETASALRDNMGDEQVRAHLKSKGVRETPEAIQAVQLELEGILQASPVPLSAERRDDDAGRRNPDRKNAAALKKRERSRAFMKQLAARARGGATISSEEMKVMFDEQPSFSAIVPEFYSGAPVAWPIRGVQIKNPQDIAALAIPLRSPYQEILKVAYLDAKNRVIDARVATLGILNASLADSKVVFGNVPEGTQSIVLSHNHPTGDPTPSPEDIASTRQIHTAAKNLGLAVLDHVITNGTRYISLKETGLLDFDGPEKKIPVPKGMSRIVKEAPAFSPSVADWEAVPVDEAPKINDPESVDRIAGWLRQADPEAAYLFMLNQKYKVIGVSRIRTEGMEFGNPNLGRHVAAVAMQYPEAAAAILDLPRIPAGFETQPSLLVDRIKMVLSESGYQLLDVIHHGITAEDGKPKYESLREAGKATFRNEEDPALSAAVGEGSAIENARREEARLAGKGMAEKENVQIAMKRYTRIIGKLWPAKGKSLGVEDAQKLLRLELKRIKKIPSRERKEVEWQIDGLASKEGSELRTAVFDVLKELDAMEGFDPSISEAAFELFADEENAAAVLEIMGIDGDAEALQEAAQKLRWAAPIWHKGVKAGWTQAERDGLYVFFLNRQKMARRAAGKFGVDNRLLMDWRAVLDGMEAVRTAAKEETRVNRALRALKAVLGADGMERMSGLVDRDPVGALRATASAIRSLVFEAHAGKILDALGGNMLLAARDVSYFLHNLDAPNLEDMAFPRIHYSVREDVRGLLGEMPWQDVFALKALEHARKRAEELGGEYDGMKAERIEAVRAKYRKKILAWLETKEPIELMSITTRLHGLIQGSTVARAYVMAGLAKEMRGNAEAIDREVRESMDEIKGQEHVRAHSMPFFERKGGMRSFLPRTDIFNANAENTVLMLAAGDMESRAYKVWFSDIHEARDRAGKAFMRVWQAMDRWYRDNGITEKMRENWRGDVKEWTFTLQPAEADAEAVVLKMNLTEAELMDLAAHLQDDETLVDVARGARIGPVRLKTTSSGTRLPARSMAYAFRRAVMESLTDVQRKVVNRMVDATTGMAPQINAMSRLLEGRDVAYSARFWSRRRDMGDADPDLPPGMRRQPGRGGLASSASSKERTSNIRGLYVKDIFDHFDEQIKWAANYAHFAMAQKMAKSALSYRMDQRARNEGEEDVTLDMRDTLSRRIGENNVDGLEFTIDRLANERRLDENWEDGFNFKRVGERIARWDAVKTLGFRVTSILNNLWGGSILLAGEMGRIGAGGAAAYWAARTRVMSPTSLKNDEIRAVKEAILEDYYFWNRIVYNRSGVQSQVIFEGAYDRAHKKMRTRVEKIRSFSLSGMSLEELHNATAAVLALMKWKGWTVDQAIRWTQFATERTQNPSSALEETNSYVFFKRHGMSILAKYWGQISVEANLLRRDFILTRGAVHKANLAAEKAAAAEKMAKASRRKMDKSGQTAFEQEAERFRAEEKAWRDKAGERARDTMRTAASIAASSFYSAAQSSILYYISRGVLPPLSKFLSRAMLHWVQDFIGRFFPELSELFQDQIVAMYQVVERLRKGQDISRTGWDRVSLMGVDSVRRLLWSVDEMRKGDVVDGAIAVFGEAGIVGGLPTGGIAQMARLFRGIYKGTTEGWETDVRKPVSKRKKGKK